MAGRERLGVLRQRGADGGGRGSLAPPPGMLGSTFCAQATAGSAVYRPPAPRVRCSLA